MNVWEGIVGFVTQSIEVIAVSFGVSEAISIMLFTVFLRVILSPISTLAMIHMVRNKAAMHMLKPQISQLNEKHKDDPKTLAINTMQLYKDNDITLFNKNSLLNILTQGVSGFAVFQAIQGLLFKSKFMWIVSLAKPDVLLAVLVGVMTYVSMTLMPASAEQANHLMFIIPAVLSVLVLVSFPSALGLSMAVSSAFSILQSVGVSLYFRFSNKAEFSQSP